MSSSRLDKKASSFEDIYPSDGKGKLSRAKSRSWANVNQIAIEPGAFASGDLMKFKPESISERAPSGQIIRQDEDENPLSAMNACVWMAASTYLDPHKKKNFVTRLEIPPNAPVKEITACFSKHLEETLKSQEFVKPANVLSFKLNKEEVRSQLLRVQEGPLILRLYHKTFPRNLDIQRLFQWVVLDNVETIENVLVADIKDPEEGLQYFVSLNNLIGRIDYDATQYQIKGIP